MKGREKENIEKRKMEGRTERERRDGGSKNLYFSPNISLLDVSSSLQKYSSRY